jgi:hypothetical protein
MVALFCGIPSCFVSYAEESMTYLLPALGIPKKVMAWCYNSNLPRQFRLLNYFNCTPDLSQIKQPYKNPTDKRIKRLIQGGSAGTALYDWFSDIQIVKNVSKEKTIHPCPIPEELIIRIILLLTKEGDTILDPFMGSGTTAVACLRTNRKYIGIEMSQKYIDIANERLLALRPGTVSRLSEMNVSECGSGVIQGIASSPLPSAANENTPRHAEPAPGFYIPEKRPT